MRPETQNEDSVRRRLQYVALATAALLFLSLPTLVSAQARGLTQPPSGGNQKASVTQFIGLVEVKIVYSSPDVTGPQGADRRGQIWGQLVPYGLTNLGFGTATEAPWRAGANENTVFTVSHDVEIQGKALPAGSYGLHMIVREEGEPWTLIFSNDSTSWGSFFYEAGEDALRVDAIPEKAPFREWLTYDFIDRQQDKATAALHWEEVRVPFEISVPNSHGALSHRDPKGPQGQSGIHLAELGGGSSVLRCQPDQSRRSADLGRGGDLGAVRRPEKLHHSADQGSGRACARQDRGSQ